MLLCFKGTGLQSMGLEGAASYPARVFTINGQSKTSDNAIAERTLLFATNTVYQLAAVLLFEKCVS